MKKTMRLKSCAYCGRIHPADYICPKKPKLRAKDNTTEAARIRSSYRWQRVREQIKERDKYICQCCARNYPGTMRQVEYDNLSVHHIISLETDTEKAFDEDNLILLCDRHHEAAEAGLISKDELISIAKENGKSGPIGA
ncbi:MAG: HNH endonuclease [Butyrivibrio sp.]|nr:HNH endonuclease [Butyrivibrio sp.]